MLASQGPRTSCGPGSTGGACTEVAWVCSFDWPAGGAAAASPRPALLGRPMLSRLPFVLVWIRFWRTKLGWLGANLPSVSASCAQTGGCGRAVLLFLGTGGGADGLALLLGRPLTSPGGGRGCCWSSSLGLMLRSSSFRFAGVSARSTRALSTSAIACAAVGGGAVDLVSLVRREAGFSALLGRDPTRVLGLTDMLCSRSTAEGGADGR